MLNIVVIYSVFAISLHLLSDLFFHSQLRLCHIPIVHANRVLKRLNVLQMFLFVRQDLHKFPHLSKEKI